MKPGRPMSARTEDRSKLQSIHWLVRRQTESRLVSTPRATGEWNARPGEGEPAWHTVRS
jgi:hypothetical protein